MYLSLYLPAPHLSIYLSVCLPILLPIFPRNNTILSSVCRRIVWEQHNSIFIQICPQPNCLMGRYVMFRKYESVVFRTLVHSVLKMPKYTLYECMRNNTLVIQWKPFNVDIWSMHITSITWMRSVIYIKNQPLLCGPPVIRSPSLSIRNTPGLQRPPEYWEHQGRWQISQQVLRDSSWMMFKYLHRLVTFSDHLAYLIYQKCSRP